MLKPRFYKLFEETIEDGARRGYHRARKHTENPTDEAVIESIVNCIMGDLHENFIFPDNDD